MSSASPLKEKVTSSSRPQLYTLNQHAVSANQGPGCIGRLARIICGFGNFPNLASHVYEFKSLKKVDMIVTEQILRSWRRPLLDQRKLG